MKRALTLLAAAVLLALAVVDLYVWLGPPKGLAPRFPRPRPSIPSPTPTTAPPTEAPTVVESPTVAPSPVVASVQPKAPKGRKPGKRPSVPAVASLPPTPAPARRAFVSSTTAIEGSSGSKAPPSAPAGFEAGGMQAKVVPRIPAQIEFDIEPKPLRPGDAYAVRIYLRNEGKKSLKIKELRVGSSLNGVRSEGTLTPKMKEIPPEQVALVAEISSVWKANVTAWGLDVTVSSGHGEVYKNSVAWR